MKLNRTILKKLVEEVLNEQPPVPPKKKPPQSKPPAAGGGGEGETSKELKIDIPDSPFNPDIGQVTIQLKDILKQWKVKEYPSDKHRWVEYHRDIVKLVQQIQGDIPDEI